MGVPLCLRNHITNIMQMSTMCGKLDTWLPHMGLAWYNRKVRDGYP